MKARRMTALVGGKFEGEADGGGLAGGGTGVDPGRVGERGLLDVVARQIRGDPAAFPFIGGIQQSEFNRGDLAPGGGMAIFIPNTDLPKYVRARGEGFTGPRNENGLVGNNFAGIPEVGCGGETGGGGSGTNFPRRSGFRRGARSEVSTKSGAVGCQCRRDWKGVRR